MSIFKRKKKEVEIVYLKTQIFYRATSSNPKEPDVFFYRGKHGSLKPVASSPPFLKAWGADGLMAIIQMSDIHKAKIEPLEEEEWHKQRKAQRP